MNRSTAREGSRLRRYPLARFARFLLALALLCFGAVACQLGGDECGWFSMAACGTPPQGAGGMVCMQGWGAGGGGDDGAGGDGVGAGGSDMGTGAGAGPGAGSTGAGGGDGNARQPPRRRARRGVVHLNGESDPVGKAQSADCDGADASLLLSNIQDATTADPQGGVTCSTPIDCLNACNAKDKFCGAARAVHPFKPPMVGDLYQCIDSFPSASLGGSYTCLYQYPNGDACIFAYAAKFGPIHPPSPPPLCVYKSPSP